MGCGTHKNCSSGVVECPLPSEAKGQLILCAPSKPCIDGVQVTVSGSVGQTIHPSAQLACVLIQQACCHLSAMWSVCDVKKGFLVSSAWGQPRRTSIPLKFFGIFFFGRDSVCCEVTVCFQPSVFDTIKVAGFPFWKP